MGLKNAYMAHLIDGVFLICYRKEMRHPAPAPLFPSESPILEICIH